MRNMLKMRPYVPSDRIAIRDSIDEEVSDDIEDDVFIRDGKSAKLNEEKGLKRPLMAPRRRNSKTPNPIPIMKKHRRCWKCCEPFCYGLAAVVVLVVLIFLAALLLTMFPIPLQKIKVWLHRDVPYNPHVTEREIPVSEEVPCSQISVQRVWSTFFSKLNSESPVRKVDLNGDKVMDIVFGYGIDDSIPRENYMKCSSHRLEAEVPCEGGVIALDGITGQVLWQRWTIANVFSLYCNIDVDLDGNKDCIVAGGGGLISAISGKTGSILWEFNELEVETNSPILTDLYTISEVRDLNADEVPDILAVHVEEREASRAGHLKLISGRSGKVIRSIPTPFHQEVFVPIQVLTDADGTEYLLIITGGQNTAGGIYKIRLHSVMNYFTAKDFYSIHQIDSTGFMVPAVLSDINDDNVSDIVVSAFNSTVFAFDGKNGSVIWSYLFPTSESISSIVPGHFDSDNVTDFMVKYNTGSGFPVYYYSETTILSGATGAPLLDAMMTDSGGPNGLLGGVSISQTFGGDIFVHWQTQCRGKYDAKDAYIFIPDSDLILQSRADTCILRYNTSTVLKLYAITRHIEPPGAVIFSSDDLNIHLNRSATLQTQKTSISPIKHPKIFKKFKMKDQQTTTSETQSQEQTTTHPTDKKRPHLPKVRQKFRRPILDNNLMNPVQQDVETPYDPIFYRQFANQQGREIKDDYELDGNPEEYEPIYNDDPQRPIRFRSKYPINRGVRSDSTEVGEDTSARIVNKTIKKATPGEPYNLWDIELEKEKQDAVKEARKNDYTRNIRETTEEKQNFLPSISSTGTLVESLDKTANSSIDFVFVLNIRESELFPPLLLPEDVHCLDEKLSSYGRLSKEELDSLQKQYLKQCLRSRLVKMEPDAPLFESQMVVTRISISCTCRDLQKDEVCSRIQSIDEQKWTEFMGNSGSGVY